jgi:hypothetical protein
VGWRELFVRLFELGNLWRNFDWFWNNFDVTGSHLELVCTFLISRNLTNARTCGAETTLAPVPNSVDSNYHKNLSARNKWSYTQYFDTDGVMNEYT